jgi:hypothetical protein
MYDDDPTFMIWGKTPDLDPADNFSQDSRYTFIIEPSVLKILFYYNNYYEKRFRKTMKKHKKPQD